MPMTVDELIAELRKCKGDSKVWTTMSHCDCECPVTGINVEDDIVVVYA